MPTVPNDFMLHGPNGWYVHLRQFGWSSDSTLLANGEEMERVDSQHRGWFLWRTDSNNPPSRLEELRRPYEKTVSYRLPEGTTVEGLKAEITPEQYGAMLGDDEELGDPRRSLYEPITETMTPDPQPIEVPARVLEGRPAPDDGLIWHASLPTELETRIEYLHLFPGYLADFRDAVKEALDAEPHVSAYKASSGGRSLKVTVTAAFDPPRHEYRKPLGGGRKRKVEVNTSRRYELRPPYRIEAESRDKAVAEWNRLVEEYVVEARALTVTACGHCEGTGLAGREVT